MHLLVTVVDRLVRQYKGGQLTDLRVTKRYEVIGVKLYDHLLLLSVPISELLSESDRMLLDFITQRDSAGRKLLLECLHSFKCELIGGCTIQSVSSPDKYEQVYLYNSSSIFYDYC